MERKSSGLSDRDVSRPRAGWTGAADLIAPPLVVLAPIVNFLTFHDYDWSRTEVVLLLAGALGLAVAYGLLLRFVPSSLHPVLLAGLLALSVDLVVGRGPLFLMLPLYFLGFFVFVLSTRSHATQIVGVSFFVLLTTTLLLPGARDIKAGYNVRSEVEIDHDLPPLIHIVLDGHIGIEGIPTDVPGGEALKEALLRFYVERGFSLYGGAFSQYSQTRDSISNLFNFRSEANSHGDHSFRTQFAMDESRYFEILSERGYVFRFYQSNFIDYCQNPDLVVASCFTHSYNSIKDIQEIPLAGFEKFRVLLSCFIDSGRATRAIRFSYNGLRRWVGKLGGPALPVWRRGPNRVAPIAAADAFNHLREDVARQSRGTVFFAHLILPHSPYVFRPECEVRENSADWLSFFDESVPRGLRNTPASRERRYIQYFEQIRCQQKMLGDLFSDLDGLGVFPETRIIVHGDHGSRISLRTPAQQRRDHADLIDGYSTLFAAKWPTLEPHYDSKAQPIQVLFGALFREDVQIPAPRDVYLEADGGTMTRVPMARIGYGLDPSPPHDG